MTTLFLPGERNEWFQDKDGIWTTTKHKDSTQTYGIEFADQLPSGETISTIDKAQGNGVTVDSSAIATGVDGTNTKVNLTISDSDGYVELKITTSGGTILEKDLRFKGIPEADPESDYRGRW